MSRRTTWRLLPCAFLSVWALTKGPLPPQSRAWPPRATSPLSRMNPRPTSLRAGKMRPTRTKTFLPMRKAWRGSCLKMATCWSWKTRTMNCCRVLAKQFMVLVFQDQQVAIFKQDPRQAFLIGRKVFVLVGRIFPARKLVGLGFILLNGEIALGGQAHDCGGKGLFVKAHTLKKAHGSRRHVVRRLIEWNNRAAGGIPAHHAPDHYVIEKYNDPAGEPEDEGFVVGNEPRALLLSRGLGYQAFGPGNH